MNFTVLLEMKNYFSTVMQRGHLSCEDRKHTQLLGPQIGQTLEISQQRRKQRIEVTNIMDSARKQRTDPQLHTSTNFIVQTRIELSNRKTKGGGRLVYTASHLHHGIQEASVNSTIVNLSQQCHFLPPPSIIVSCTVSRPSDLAHTGSNVPQGPHPCYCHSTVPSRSEFLHSFDPHNIPVREVGQLVVSHFRGEDPQIQHGEMTCLGWTGSNGWAWSLGGISGLVFFHATSPQYNFPSLTNILPIFLFTS